MNKMCYIYYQKKRGCVILLQFIYLFFRQRHLLTFYYNIYIYAKHYHKYGQIKLNSKKKSNIDKNVHYCNNLLINQILVPYIWRLKPGASNQYHKQRSLAFPYQSLYYCSCRFSLLETW